MQNNVSQGLLNLPGSSPASKALVERLLDEDCTTHHCYFGTGLHNHLSHHLLAAYDLGAPPALLQAIYDAEAAIQRPIDFANRAAQATAPPAVTIDAQNWTEHLGPDKNYAAYLAFFEKEIERLGVPDTLETYIFAPRANGNGAEMLLRFFGGILHPFIQVGHGVEFGLPSLVASGLAQTSVSPPVPAALYDDSPPSAPSATQAAPPPRLPKSARQPSSGPSLLAILAQAYADDALTPVLPYDPDAFLSKRQTDALADPRRPAAIRRLAAQWTIDPACTPAESAARVEELLWAATLLLAGTGKRGRKPRADFFLMHLLTASLFLPPLLRAIPRGADRARLLRAMLSTLLFTMLLRGRPRIDAPLLMSYTATPAPPGAEAAPQPDASALGGPGANPWPALVAGALPAPDAHTLKVVRALHFAAQRFGRVPPGGAIGAFDDKGVETLLGMADVDGSVFVRAAGVVLDALGWVGHGQKEGEWDRSALGWDAAWEAPDE